MGQEKGKKTILFGAAPIYWFGLAMFTAIFAGFSPGSVRNRVVQALADFLQRYLALSTPLNLNQVADGLHGLLYSGFGFCLYLSFGYSWQVLIGACLFASATEIVQEWVPERTPSLLDAFINVTALVTGVVLGIAFKRLYMARSCLVDRWNQMLIDSCQE